MTTPATATFEELLLPVLDGAYATALHLTRERQDAEDLVQEAALLACRGFGGFRPGTNFRAWFFRILSNAFYSRYRRRRREGTALELEDTPELYLYARTAGAGLHGRSEDPAGLLLDRLDQEEIGAAVDALPEEYRMVAALYLLQDFSYQEIAGILEVPVGTVRSRLHRARRMLQRGLWRIAEERGIIRELVQTGEEAH